MIQIMKTKYICRILGALFFILFTHTLSAQVYYYYDNNGNRITSTYTHHAPERRQDSNKVIIYPNPTNGMLNVSISSFGNCGYADIYIVDGSGNIISTQKTSSALTTVNLTSYNQGMYYLRAVLCDQQYACKIVKVNPGAPGKPLAAPVKY
jgi:hypothetical protein